MDLDPPCITIEANEVHVSRRGAPGTVVSDRDGYVLDSETGLLQQHGTEVVGKVPVRWARVIRGLYSLNGGRLIARADRRRWVLLEEVGRSGRVRTSVVSRARHAQLAIHWPTGSAVLWTARSRYLGSKLTRFDAEAGTTRTDSAAAMERTRIHLDKRRIARGTQGTHAYYVEVDDKRPWYRLPSELHGWCGGFLVSDFGLHAVEEGLPVVLEVPVRREAGCTATLWPVDRGCVIQHPDGSVSLVDMTGTEPRAEALSVVGQHDGEPL